MLWEGKGCQQIREKPGQCISVPVTRLNYKYHGEGKNHPFPVPADQSVVEDAGAGANKKVGTP